MVLWLGYTDVNKGYYAGIIEAAFPVGSLLTCYIITCISDRKGHIVTLKTLLFANAVLSLLLGFSQHIMTIIILRFLMGVCDAIMPLAKAFMYPFTNNDNHAKAMSSICLSSGIAGALGTVLGGVFASPTKLYPHVFSRYEFFFILPTFVGFMFNMIAFLLCRFLYKSEYETVTKSEETTVESTLIEMDEPAASNSSISLHSGHKSNNNEKSELLMKNDDNTCCSIWTKILRYCKESSLVSLLSNKYVLAPIFIYPGFAMVIDTYPDISSVWMSTNKDSGGLEYSSKDIGIVSGLANLPAAFIQFLLFPIARHIGAVKSFVLFAVFGQIAMILQPMSVLAADSWYQWAAVVSCYHIIQLSDYGCSAAMSVIVNNSITHEKVGSVNGLSRSFSSLGKGLGRLIIGSVFAASISSNIGPPVDHNLPFAFMGTIIWITAIMVYFIPQKTENGQ